MTNKRLNLVKYVIIFILVLLISFLIPTYFVADAVLPSNYVDNYKGQNNPVPAVDMDYDWYVEDLDIDSVRETIESMMASKDIYDFSYFEEHPIILAVVDTGVNYNHELFLGKYDKFGHPVYLEDENHNELLGEYDVFYRDGEGEIICYNAYADYKNDEENIFNVMDNAPDLHGSHVCGIVSILIHELNLEKYIKILPIKASYPDGSGSKFPSQALQKALVFALQKGATVVNMSLAGTNTNYKITPSYARKAIFVAAAGNEGSKSVLYYPAADSNVIGVMGYTINDSGKAVFYSKSNINNAYDVVAPAQAIISVDGSGTNTYKTLTGTSMASPIVAFASALALLKYGALEQKLGIETTIPEVTSIVKNSTTRTISSGKNTYGIFDFAKMLNADSQAYCRINIDSNNASQKINDVSIVKMHLTTYPESTGNKGTVQWTVEQSGKVIKTISGFDIDFLPLKEIGDVTITAEWTYNNSKYEDEYIVNIGYADLEVNKVNNSINTITETYQDNYILGYPVINTLSGLDYIDPESVGKIMWYVNGEYAHVNGATFTFTPKESGEYTIQAKLNTTLISQNVISFIDESEIPEEKDQTKSIIIICLIVGASLLVVAIFITIVVVTVKKKKANRVVDYNKKDEGGINLFNDEVESTSNNELLESETIDDNSEVVDDVQSSDETVEYEAEVEYEVEAEVEDPQDDFIS